LGKIPRTYQQVISTMLQNGLLREGTELIKEARTALDQPGFFSYQMASLYTSRMDYTQATEEFLLYYLHRSKRDENFLVSQLSQFPDDPEVHTQVREVLQHAIEEHADDNKLRKVLADYLYRIREYDAALAQYQKLETRENTPGKHRLAVAHHLLNDGEYEYALQLYKSLRNTSNLPKYELLLGYAEAGYRQMLDRYSESRPEMTFSQNTLWAIDFVIIPEEAGSQLSQIVSDYQEVSAMESPSQAGMIADYRLGELYLKLGNDFDRAIDYFSRCAADSGHPRKVEALMNIGYCYLAKGDLTAARDHWETAVRSLPNKKSSLRNHMLLQIAGTYLYEGDLSQGIAQLRQVQDSTGISSELYNDILEVQTLIAEALKNTSASDSTTLRQFFQAEFYVKQHKITEAQNAHLRVLDLAADAPIAPYSLLRTAQLGRLLNQTPQVIDWLTRIIQDYETSKLGDQATFMLAELYREQGNYDDAIRWYEKILVDYPSSILEQKARKTIRELQAQTS
ncbi:MAG TPA: tetratricopeptide repeat protein, partial [bacterium]|nr:tetratricopeptide repeat protein [bacterium]